MTERTRKIRRNRSGPGIGAPIDFDGLELIYRSIDELRPFDRNARTHSDRQIRQLAVGIAENGFTNPVLTDGGNTILAGHARVEAAKLLGMTDIPTIPLRMLTEAQTRAYVIADNRLAELAGWDEPILAIELQRLIELDYDVEITGFSTAEIDGLVHGSVGTDADPVSDRLPVEDPARPVVTVRGDLWLLGHHRLSCGDAQDPGDFRRLMGKAKAQMVFTDPPYNVRIDGHVCGKGAVRHDEFVMASGELSRPEFIVFLSGAITNLIAFSADGSIHFICMDWRHIGELLTAAEPRYTEFKNLCVWNKTNAGMGSFYRSKHELVLVFKHGRLPHINNFGLGEKGRYRTNVWDYASVNTLKPDRRDELELHPTTKPVALVADSIRDCSKRSGVILDCFAGSGTTIIAAERTGRRARAMELDSRHVDTALRRWRDFSGQEAVHATTGESFSMVAERRLAEKPVAEPQDTTKERTRSNTDHGQ